MKIARISLAFIMLLAIVFKSLPDSVFDHFHQHEHAVADSKNGDFVGSYKHNCHIDDWNFECFEPSRNHFPTAQLSVGDAVIILVPGTQSLDHPVGIGRAPPIV